MSARMEIQRTDWESADKMEPDAIAHDLSTIQVECLIRNSDKRNLVASVREVHAQLREPITGGPVGDHKRRAALALQEQWDTWFVQRDQLRSDIKRGRECLDQVNRELIALRARLEDWPAYERICGRNPLTEYMQSLTAKQSIAQFLPAWLERRERQLQDLGQRMEQYAKQHGVEHLL